MTPAAVRILANEMVVLFRMNDQCDLAGISGAATAKGGAFHRNIHLHQSFDDLARTILFFVEHFRHLSRCPRLVILGIAFFCAWTRFVLILIDHVQSIGKTVVSASDLRIIIPRRIVGWFIA